MQIWLIAMALEPGSISLLEVLVINPIIVLLLVAVPLSPGGLGRTPRAHFPSCSTSSAPAPIWAMQWV
jgi:hypothetical protein